MTPAGPGWTGPARLGGEALFRTRVMDAIGAGLFLHIEHAAGGLAGLSFRFVITDPVGCRAWPEGRRAKLRPQVEAPSSSTYLIPSESRWHRLLIIFTFD
jgi:hypothetical protein